MWNEYVGQRSESVLNRVEHGAVRKFAESIGDLNPLYLDEAAAAGGRWGELIAPPTFPRAFDFGAIEGIDLPSSGLIHGEQTYEYRRPLRVGEAFQCYTVFEDQYEKKGGELTFLIFRRVGEDEKGEVVFTAKEVVIVTKAAMRGSES